MSIQQTCITGKIISHIWHMFASVYIYRNCKILSEVQTLSFALFFYQTASSHQPPQFGVYVCVCVSTKHRNGYVRSDQAKNSRHTPGRTGSDELMAHTHTHTRSHIHTNPTLNIFKRQDHIWHRVPAYQFICVCVMDVFSMKNRSLVCVCVCVCPEFWSVLCWTCTFSFFCLPVSECVCSYWTVLCHLSVCVWYKIPIAGGGLSSA